ncbi:MAG: DUF4387 family protein [Pseudomonadota bacterium]
MATIQQVCRHIRSKNAGPFWVTIDFFFNGKSNFERYHDRPALSAAAIGAAFGVDPAMVRHYPVPELNVLKVSYPRANVQGGVEERDMHCGQQYVRLLGIELD